MRDFINMEDIQPETIRVDSEAKQPHLLEADLLLEIYKTLRRIEEILDRK